ncbi:5429_t:CDS:2 [Ambispora gerdemannii]|uniref:5429_t:CDS:1 n=1 Tax=Ambispora gerdemannii TaxID=144530 RepID=A0A9N8WGJ1_9GLOM|nr:5429_t:CDS:2 [Ambispora gerdemannii]
MAKFIATSSSLSLKVSPSSFFCYNSIIFFWICCCLVFGSGGEAKIKATTDTSDVGVTLHGQSTFYHQTGTLGSCGKFSRDRDMNGPQYDQHNPCGRCVKIVGPRGSAKVRIVDRCADCPWGNIDLSPVAFSKIANTEQGRVPVTWGYVKC